MNLWIKPGVLVGAVQDDGHSIMNLAHEGVRRSRHNGERAAFGGRASLPSIPDARNTHDRVVLKVDFEWALLRSVLLPFEKSA